jgi:predicted O-methyltransferase YrrM
MANLFFEINHNNNSKIEFTESNIKFNYELVKKYDYYSHTIKTRYIDDEYFKNKIKSVEYLSFNDSNYLFLIFDINLNGPYTGFIRADYIRDKFNFNIDSSRKYKTILQNMVSLQMYNYMKEMKYCDREDFLYNYRLEYIALFFDLLEPGGNVFIGFLNYCNNNSFELLYLLSCLFEKVILYNGIYIYCDNFLYNNSTVTKEDILKCIKNKDFTITNKQNINEFTTYINNQVKNLIDDLQLLKEKKYDEYIENRISIIYETFSHKKISKETVISFYKIILTKFKKVILNNKLMSTNSSIKDVEGTFLSNVIKKNNFIKCLEVGMAFGVSSLYILSSQDNVELISIDPYQKSQWQYYGIKLLKNFNLDKRHKLMLEKDYVGLPKLLDKYGPNYFDLIFIDGFHTFDYTLLDFFYADLLLKINGIIIVDDALHKGVSKCIKYIDENYKQYKKIESPITVAAYLKNHEDKREWNFHRDF